MNSDRPETPRDWNAIEESLRRSFEPPDLERITETVSAQAAGRGTEEANNRIWWLRPALVAAAVLLVAFFLPLAQKYSQQGPSHPDPELQTKIGQGWNNFYLSTRASSFRPSGSCSVQIPASEYSEARPPGGVSFRDSPSVTLIGEMHTPHVETPKCALIHVTREDAYLFVYVLELATDPQPVLPDDTKLYLHRRELGHLVLYELSPLREARSLELFSLQS